MTTLTSTHIHLKINPVMTTQFSAQDAASLNNSSDNTVSPSSSKTKKYGPISVRICRKSMPTLKTGRLSKHLVLVGEDAIKREKRREKNRDAARKLKEKRQIIEEELNQKVRELESQYSHLQNYVNQLHQKKQHLNVQLNNQILNEIYQLLSGDSSDNSSQYEQYSPDMKLFDDGFEEILNDHLKTSFHLLPQN